MLLDKQYLKIGLHGDECWFSRLESGCILTDLLSLFLKVVHDVAHTV